MASVNDFRVGDKVLFGRSHGEKTLGEVVKVNPSRLKVKQLESRGGMRSHPVGAVWTVPPSLCEKVADGAAAAPMAASPAPNLLDMLAPKAAVRFSGFRPGDRVVFNAKGQDIVGTVLRLNGKTVAVQPDNEPKGRYWRVSPGLLRKLEGDAAKPSTKPAKRSDNEIMRDIVAVYASLSPENLTCDGELSRSAVMARRVKLLSRLSQLQTELGRLVSESAAWNWHQTDEAMRSVAR